MGECWGDRLNKIRREQGKTIKQLACESGVSERAIKRYENEGKYPKLDIASKMADSLKVSLDYLAGRTEDTTVYAKTENGDDVSLTGQELDCIKKLRNVPPFVRDAFVQELTIHRDII